MTRLRGLLPEAMWFATLILLAVAGGKAIG